MVLVTWDAVAGRSYILQNKDYLADTNWTDTPADVVATKPGQVVVTQDDNLQRFYRVVLEL